MTDYTDDFSRFWRAYNSPKNSSKSDSMKAWAQKTKARPAMELHLAAVESYDNWLADQHKLNGKGFPAKKHAATWLRGECWDTFLDDAEAILRARQGHAQADLSASAKSWTEGWRTSLRTAGVDANQMEKWFLPATMIFAVASNQVEIRCPSLFHRNEMEKRFSAVIRKAFGDNVNLTVSKENGRSET